MAKNAYKKEKTASKNVVAKCKCQHLSINKKYLKQNMISKPKYYTGNYNFPKNKTQKIKIS